MTERDLMLAGKLYDPLEPGLAEDRERARKYLHQFNQSSNLAARRQILTTLLGKSGSSLTIEAPFFCDYGYNIRCGDNVYINYNCVFLDCNTIEIGSNTLIGPAVQLYTATHPLSAEERRHGKESAHPIIIAENVWIGGSAIVCPGVSIGANSVIGAGSVVTKDIPAGVVAFGNPCRINRKV